MSRIIAVIFLSLAVTAAAAAQSGTLIGNVHDSGTGEALPGVNVILKGTYYGAATDINGKFKISGISPGSYNVDISLIGYKTVQFTNIVILAGKTKELDVKLEETVLRSVRMLLW